MVPRLAFFVNTAIIPNVIASLVYVLTISLVQKTNSQVWFLLLFILLIAYMVSILSFNVRDLHDINLSGFYVLLYCLPVISSILYLVLLFKSVDMGQNRFG